MLQVCVSNLTINNYNNEDVQFMNHNHNFIANRCVTECKQISSDICGVEL